MKRVRAIGSVLTLMAALSLAPGLTPAYAAGVPLTGYGTSTGGTVCDTVNEINPAYSDVACASGSSAFVGSDGSTLAFGLVTEVDPRTTQNGGPLESTAYVVAIAVNGTQVATVGVDGKQVNNTNYVYAKCFGNATLTYNKLVTTATSDGSFVVTPMAGTPYYRVDFTIPLSALSGCGITTTTPVQLYYGSSQAANLDVINKDFFRDGDTAVTFGPMATVTFGGSIALTKTATPVSGPNPPGPGQTSTYDLAVKASNTSVYPLTGVQVLDDLPAGVTIVSRTATVGTPTVTGQHIAWSGFDLAAGTSATMTIRVSITPPASAVGSTFLLNAGATGSAARGDGVAVTASSNSVSTGVVSGPVLTLSKTASPTFVAAGGVVGYTITLGNSGTAAASVTAVTDTLPSGFAFVPGSTGGTLGAAPPTVSGSTVTWNGPFALAVGASRTLTFSATASATPGSFTNTATATASNAATVSTGPTAAVTVNAPPSAQADSATTARATAASIDVLANDTDPDANPLTITAIGTPSNGTAVLDGATKRIVYTPGAGFSGTATFSYTVSDGFGGSSTATVTVTVTNGAPVANADTLTATPGTAVPVDVLANDTDPEGDALTVTSVSTATHGTVTLSGGTVSYTADPSYVGSDSFTYTISDSHGGTATASVAVTIPNTAPTAVNDDAAGFVDSPVTVSVLNNDTDPNAGQTLTVTGVTQPAHGATTVNGNGTITYAPSSGYVGPDSFDYTISDGAGGTAVATVTVTVTAGAPVAVDDFASTPTDAAATVAVLSNDVGSGTLSVVNLTQPLITPPVGPPSGSAGSAVLNANGTVTYTPKAGFTGTATFTYRVTNGSSTSASPATVTITVLNASPVAVDDSVPNASRAAGQPIDVLANDTDANGDPLAITAVGSTSQGGTVTVNGAGTGLVYSPAVGFTGTETFTYTITDGRGGSDSATVTVTVLNANPVANADSLLAVPGAAAPVDVTANDTDADGDSLVVTAVGSAAHGTAALSGGAVTYTADSSYVGPDSFTYTVTDGHGGTASATVSVTVPNTSPNAVGDSASVVNGSSTTVSVLANDTDPNAGQTLTVTAAGPAAHGTVTVNVDGTITYAVTGNYQGPDSFDYTISDGAGGTDTATVSMTVTGRAPVGVDDSATTATDTDVTVPVLANDTDPDGDVLAVVPGSVTSPFAGGVTQLNPNGTITYTPAAGFAGVATFSYSVTDGTFTDTASITITVLNAAPVANADSITGTPGAAVPVDVLTNDTDPNGDPLTVTAVGAAAHGTATLTGGAVSYTASGSYVGPDSFTYTISDGAGGTATATVSVTIGNSPPVANDDLAGTATNTDVTVAVLANDTDANGDTLAVVPGSVTTPAPGGTAVLNPNGTITYSPPTGYAGTVTFDYTVTDGTSTDSATVTVTVGNAAPVANADTVSTNPGLTVPVAVLTNDTDANGDPLTVTAVGAAAHGTASLTAGAVTYAADSTYVGSDSFTYTISDGAGGTATATVTVTVDALAEPTPTPTPTPTITPPTPTPAVTPSVTPSSAPVPFVSPPVPSPLPSVPGPVNHPPAYTDAPANTTQAVAPGEPLAPLAATDPDGNRLSYALISGDLPAGVRLQADGAFTGAPTVAGSYPVVLRVCDDGTPILCSDTHLTIQVASVAGPPASPPAAPSPTPAPAPEGEGSARIDPAPARPLLPRTGAPIALLLLTGLGSLLTGFGVRYAGRPRPT